MASVERSVCGNHHRSEPRLKQGNNPIGLALSVIWLLSFIRIELGESREPTLVCFVCMRGTARSLSTLANHTAFNVKQIASATNQVVNCKWFLHEVIRTCGFQGIDFAVFDHA